MFHVEYRNTSWACIFAQISGAAGFSTHNMAWPSNMTKSTLWVMSSYFSGASSRHRTISDLVPSLSFPLADSDGGHG